MIIGLLPDMGNWVHSMGYFRNFRETISTAFKKKKITFFKEPKQVYPKKQKETVYYAVKFIRL